MPKSTKQTHNQKTLQITPRVKDEISVVFACDKKYAPYLAVCLFSLREHLNKNREYTVYILNSDGIAARIQREFEGLETDYFKICIVDITSLLANYPDNLFYEQAHFSAAMYYRLFIPYLFSSFKKVIYCDCDGIFLADVAELYDVELGNNYVAAVPDTGRRTQIYKSNHYFKEELKLKDPYQYFNSGVLVFNIQEQNKEHFISKCLSVLQQFNNLSHPDQDVLNVVCEGKVRYLRTNWNVENLVWSWRNLKRCLPDWAYEEFMEGTRSIKFLHYTGSIKPWEDPDFLHSEIWWHYARQTGLYESLLRQHIWEIPKRAFFLPLDYVRYIGCRLLRHVTWGRRRQVFLNKELYYRERVKSVQRWLRS